MTDEEVRTLRAVNRSLSIVESLVDANDPLGVTEISNRTKIPISTVHIHLQTLRNREYVLKENGLYRLSLRYLHHGGTVREQIPIYRNGRDVVQEIASTTGELVNLSVEENGRGVVIYMSKGEDAAFSLAPVGKYSHLHQPAYGKAILAQHSNKHIDDIIDRWGLEPLTANTITERSRLFDEIETVRERGYAVERDEGDIGISCIGAPITSGTNEPLGAISATVPSSKLRDETVEQDYLQTILNGANIIELKIENL